MYLKVKGTEDGTSHDIVELRMKKWRSSRRGNFTNTMSNPKFRKPSNAAGIHSRYVSKRECHHHCHCLHCYYKKCNFCAKTDITWSEKTRFPWIFCVQRLLLLNRKYLDSISDSTGWKMEQKFAFKFSPYQRYKGKRTS